MTAAADKAGKGKDFRADDGVKHCLREGGCAGVSQWSRAEFKREPNSQGELSDNSQATDSKTTTAVHASVHAVNALCNMSLYAVVLVLITTSANTQQPASWPLLVSSCSQAQQGERSSNNNSNSRSTIAEMICRLEILAAL